MCSSQRIQLIHSIMFITANTTKTLIMFITANTTNRLNCVHSHFVWREVCNYAFALYLVFHYTFDDITSHLLTIQPIFSKTTFNDKKTVNIVIAPFELLHFIMSNTVVSFSYCTVSLHVVYSAVNRLTALTKKKLTDQGNS